MPNITPIILAGGVGSRLWPASRKSFPKQFVPFLKNESLFAEALKRSDQSEFLEPIVITANEYRFVVNQLLKKSGQSATVLLEPVGRNTAPAILGAVYYMLKQRGDALVLVMPSDHYIPNREAFRDMVLKGAQAADNGSIVTFGVNPTRPETGYGYLEVEKTEKAEEYRVLRFHEKPDVGRAIEMLSQESFLWNSGIFLFKASNVLALAKRLNPQLVASVESAIDNVDLDSFGFQINCNKWERIQNISFDYAIMEKAENIRCIGFDGVWSDLGDWSAIKSHLSNDQSSNATTENADQIDCTDSLLWSNSENIHLVGLGLKNIVSIVTDDAVLIADASRSQDVGSTLARLREKGVFQADKHRKDYRPWGWFESLVNKQSYQVKRLYIYSGAALSLQSHQHRSEHWVVVSGEATVVIEDEVMILQTNDSVFIKAGQKHRLSNNSNQTLVIIEVQTGSYLGEDDIVRFEDIYSR